MADVIGRRIAGNLAYIDKSGHLKRVVDAIGPDVVKYQAEPHQFQENAGSATDPRGWTTTVVEVGTGTSEADASNAAGETFRIVTAANEDDGLAMQLNGESFELTADQHLYFGMRLKASDATQSDFFVGLGITDTTPLGGISDAVYFEKLDGGTGISAVTEKNSTETQSDSLGTLVADTYVTLEYYFDGAAVEFFVNGVSQAVHTTNIPDDEPLRLTVQFLAGSAGAKTLTVQWLRVIQIGR